MATSNSAPPSEENLVTSNSAPPSEKNMDYIAGLSRLTKQTANNIYEFLKLLYNEETAEQYRREDLSPLHYCCMEDDSITAAALIQAGANINHVGKYKMTPLDLAAGCGSVKCVELLCDLSKNLPSLEELEYYISIATDEEQKLRIQQCRSILYQRMEALADKCAALLIEESETEKVKKKKKSSTKKSSKHSSKSATNG